MDMQTKHQIESLILDLRGNGGGLIDEAVKIMGYFVPKGTEVVSTKGKTPQASHTYRTTLDPIFPDMKLVVLVNNASASASEILAGAVQDLDRGIVVGERTFGKGLVQNIRPVSYGGHVKVTTAKYYIPSGRCLQAIDYAQRKENGILRRVPDSLSQAFKTRGGRTVLDGGGIIPDSITQDNARSILHIIFTQNLYFSFANRYVAQHASIPQPAEFKLTDQDFDDFIAFIQRKEVYLYPQTKEYFDECITFPN